MIECRECNRNVKVALTIYKEHYWAGKSLSFICKNCLKFMKNWQPNCHYAVWDRLGIVREAKVSALASEIEEKIEEGEIIIDLSKCKEHEGTIECAIETVAEKNNWNYGNPGHIYIIYTEKNNIVIKIREEDL